MEKRRSGFRKNDEIAIGYIGLVIVLALPFALLYILNQAEVYSQIAFPHPATLAESSSSIKTIVQSGHRARVDFIAFSPDGDLLATGDEDRNVKIWQISSRRLLSTWKLDAEYGPDHLFFDKQGRLVVISRGGFQAALEPLTGKETERTTPPYIDDHQYSDLFLSQDGGTAVTWDDGRKSNSQGQHPLKASFWSVPEGTLIKSLDLPEEFELSPRADFAALVKRETNRFSLQVLKISDEVRTKALTFTGSTPPTCQILALSSNGRLVVLLWIGEWSGLGPQDTEYSFKETEATVWRISDGALMARFPASSEPYHCTFSPDGRYLACQESASQITVYKLAPRQDLYQAEKDAHLVESDYFGAFAFHPSQPYLAWGGIGYGPGTGDYYETARIAFLDLRREVFIQLHRETGPITSLALSNSGDLLALAEITRDSRQVRVFDLRHARLLWTGLGPKDREEENCPPPVVHLVFSADEKYLAGKGRDGTIYVWRAGTGELIREIPDNGCKEYGGLALSSDGQVLVNAAKNWLEVFRLDQKYPQYLDACNAVGVFFSDSDRRLVEVSVQETNDPSRLEVLARVLDLDSGQAINSFRLGERETSSSAPWPLMGPDVQGEYFVFDRKIYELAGGNIAGAFENLEGLARSNHGRFRLNREADLAVSPYGQNYVRLSRSGEGVEISRLNGDQLVATLYSSNQGAAFVTPDGFFKVIGDYLDEIHWVQGEKAIRTSELISHYHRPSLVTSRLQGDAGP
ncbi:MAG: WD40 repeat domain-containing protein [Thermodesulfobacteriota bacterium]